MGSADAFSDVLSQVPAGSSSAFSGVLSQIPGATSGGGVAHSPAIKEMQQAIINLGKTLVEHKEFNDFLHSRFDGKFDANVMEAVGNAGKADGAWGAKTDAGLHSVLDLAETLEKMHSSMGLKSDSYDAGVLKGIIPDTYKNAGADVASKLTEEVGKLAGVYSSVAMFMQQRYGNKLSDDAAVIKYPGGLNGQESDYVKTNGDSVAVRLMDGTPVLLKDLASEQTLKAFFQRTYPGKTFDAKTQADWMLKQLERSK